MNDDGTVYLVLTEKGGKLMWNIIHPIGIGAMIEAAAALDNMARRQVVAPAPQPVKEAIEEE